MQRRQMLAGLGVFLSAGCLGAKRPATSSSGVRIEGGRPLETTTPAPTPSSTSKPTDTPTPEPTETPEPTDALEPGPSEDAVDAGAEAVARVQSELTAAVDAYVGDDGVSAASVASGFDVRPVFLALDGVQRALVAAEEAAVTDDQRETVSDLQMAEQFLTQSALAHSYLSESVGRLDVDSFTGGLDAAGPAETQFDAVLDRGSTAVSTLKNDVDGDAVAVAEALDDDSYETTVSAFETVRSVLKSVSSGLDRTVQGLDELADAREAEADDDDEEAAETADEARTRFDEAYAFLDDAVNAADDAEMDALASTLESFQSLVDEYYLDAQDVYDDTR